MTEPNDEHSKFRYADSQNRSFLNNSRILNTSKILNSSYFSSLYEIINPINIHPTQQKLLNS